MTHYGIAKQDPFDFGNSIIQGLMNFASKEVVSRKDMALLSKPEFWSRLPSRARMAVFVGNLNYQVGNGGFSQWVFNGYDECADELVPFLEKLPQEGPKVAAIIRFVMYRATIQSTDEDLDSYKGTDLSFWYYGQEASFLREVEAILQVYKTDEELDDWMKRTANMHSSYTVDQIIGLNPE